MEDKKTFSYTYSAEMQEEIKAIREKYAPTDETEDKMAKLRFLDARVTKRASLRAISVGTLGALVMGAGMSLIMSELGKPLGAFAMPLGILTGALGMGVIALAYPLYNRTLKKEREKIAPEIIRLTDELSEL